MLLDRFLASRFFAWFFGSMHGRDDRGDMAPARAAASAVAFAVLAGCGGGGGGAGTGFPVSATSGTKSTPTEQPPDKQPAPPCSVAFWGDSISAMTAPRLPKGLAVNLHGVIGGTALAAQPALLQDALSERFQVLEYGTNDANGGSPYEPAMRAMLDRIKAVGRTPVVVGLSNATAGNLAVHANLNLLAGQLAKEYGAIWVDWASVPWSPSDLMADGVHPVDAYQQRLADKLSDAITVAAPECRS